MRSFLVSALLAAVLIPMPLLAPAAAEPAGPERQTDQGRLLGEKRGSGVEVYRAVPYARPPVGSRRWRPPEPAPGWSGVRDARNPSPQCVQAPYPEQSIFTRPSLPTSEDCLYLNVWTAAEPGEDAPVMVWIHGGGLTRGTGATEAYDGENLARRGAVVVTINYRLGAFGFLAHPELSAESSRGVSGNQGFLDQVAALRWVREHIEAFGGDPDRVTIFGESAGSWSVNALMVMPAAEGLFHRAIGQSGAGFAPRPLLTEPLYGMVPAETWGERLQGEVGAEDLDALREVPAERILAAAGELGLPANAAVGGVVVPDQPAVLFSEGRQHPVPVIVGFNADEGTSLTAPGQRPRDARSYRADIERRFGDDGDRVLDLYPPSMPEASWLGLFRDKNFGWEMVRWADAMENVPADAWMYYFTFAPSGPYREALGAYHAAEIRYVFDTVHLNDDASLADRRLADRMADAWVSFAEDGVPAAQGLPDWAPWDPERRNYLELAADPGMRAGLIEDASVLFDSLDPSRLVR